MLKKIRAGSGLSAFLLLGLCLTLGFGMPQPAWACDCCCEDEDAEMLVLEGTASYRQRIALLAGAELKVSLEDVSRADAPAEVLAEYSLRSNGEQVPLPFRLELDPALWQAGHRYVLRASISIEGQPRFSTTTSYPVLESAESASGLELLLQMGS